MTICIYCWLHFTFVHHVQSTFISVEITLDSNICFVLSALYQFGISAWNIRKVATVRRKSEDLASWDPNLYPEFITQIYSLNLFRKFTPQFIPQFNSQNLFPKSIPKIHSSNLSPKFIPQFIPRIHCPNPPNLFPNSFPNSFPEFIPFLIPFLIPFPIPFPVPHSLPVFPIPCFLGSRFSYPLSCW